MSRKLPRFLDWRDDGVNHWMNGKRLPCRICRRLTWLCDDQQQPCHKTCADKEFETSISTRRVA